MAQEDPSSDCCPSRVNVFVSELPQRGSKVREERGMRGWAVTCLGTPLQPHCEGRAGITSILHRQGPGTSLPGYFLLNIIYVPVPSVFFTASAYLEDSNAPRAFFFSPLGQKKKKVQLQKEFGN